MIVIFQLSLALGAPLGHLSMGGKYPGKYPKKMRLIALINILVLGLVEGIMLIRSGLILDDLFKISQIAIWFVVAFFVLGSLMNLASPSKWERILWAPVNLVLLGLSLMVALS